jgi:mannose-6-phosphate isomerase-like protein (cupin superfamily)
VSLGTVQPKRIAIDGLPSSLGRCTGDVDAFLRTEWGVRSALYRGTDPDGFADLLTLEDVDRIVSTMSLRSPAFRLVRGGEQIPEAAYTRSGRTGSKPVSGMADAARVFELFREGATIVLQGLHRYWEPVTLFVRDLELELGHACQTNAYITPPGAQGLALHSDPHDVFVLQAFGRKHWEVHALSAPAEDGDPLEAEVGPGDCIYIPVGTPHAASTQETLSGHLTIGVHVTTWRDVAADAWKRLELDPSFDEPVPPGWFRDRDAFADELGTRLRSLRSAVDAVDPRAIADERADRFLSTRPQLARGVLIDESILSAIDGATRFRRRTGSVCELDLRGERLVALLGDRRLEMPPWLEPAMRRVASPDAFTMDDLAADLPDGESRKVLLRRLVREGSLTIERGC